jgi:uncharacterized protein YndB with AHSA1/START domain
MAEPTDTTTVERTESFPVPPDVLWHALTDPDLLTEWFGNVGFDLEPGGAITDGDAPGAAGEPTTIGVVETVEPPRRIGFVWIAPGSVAPSSVELEIDDAADSDDGSTLRVRETRLEPRWEPRPDWFTVAGPPRACAGVGPRA